MKIMITHFKAFFITLCLLHILAPKAFTQEVDKIVKVKGDTLSVIVQAVSESSVTYLYPNEKATNTISKQMIREIIYSSGRRESFTNVVSVKSEKDWKKVIITTNPSDVMGLTLVKGIKNQPWQCHRELLRRAIEDIKKAFCGAHIFLMQSSEYSAWPITNVVVVGNAYSY